jgi:5-methylcytosine-specific restriction protein A
MASRPRRLRPAPARKPFASIKPAYERDRESPSKRGYDRAWQRLRRSFLHANPLCLFCDQAGRVKAAEVVDHIEPIRVAPSRRLDPTNLRSLCKSCHDRRTFNDVVNRR